MSWFSFIKKEEKANDALFVISEIEEIRYKISEKLDTAKSGDTIQIEDVFGDSISPDQYAEFIKMGNGNSHMFAQSEKEFQEALKEVQNKSDSPMYYLRVGNAFATGVFAEQNLTSAYKMFVKAAEMGDAYAMDRVGGSYLHGAGVEQNAKEAVEWYKKSILADGCPDGLLDLALCYTHGNGVKQNNKLAVYFMERAAKQGNGPAQNNMGYFYREGIGVEADLEKALYWYERSAGNNYPDAAQFLLRHYIENDEGEKAESVVNKIERMEYAVGMYNAGIAYRDGKTLAKSTKRAFELFSKAAAQGLPPALYECALMYGKGIYVAEDFEKATNLLHQAANGRYPLAEFTFARMIWDSDNPTAKIYIQDAANQGYGPAIEFLNSQKIGDKTTINN